MKTISQATAKTLMHKTNGKVFTAVFTKKDGSMRKMNCRLGVHSHANGKGLKYIPARYGLMTVFDMQVGAYRSVNMNTLNTLQISGKVYFVNQAA